MSFCHQRQVSHLDIFHVNALQEDNFRLYLEVLMSTLRSCYSK